MEQQILLLGLATRKKLKILAQDDGRSMSKYIEYLLRSMWNVYKKRQHTET